MHLRAHICVQRKLSLGYFYIVSSVYLRSTVLFALFCIMLLSFSFVILMARLLIDWIFFRGVAFDLDRSYINQDQNSVLFTLFPRSTLEERAILYKLYSAKQFFKKLPRKAANACPVNRIMPNNLISGRGVFIKLVTWLDERWQQMADTESSSLQLKAVGKSIQNIQ